MQDILIHARDFEKRTPALQFGVRLAAKLGAAVTAAYACPEPVYIAPAFEPELMTVVLENTRRLMQEAVQARRAFMDWAATLGAPAAEWLVAQGPTADALAQAATRHDLMVLDHGREDRDSPWDIPGLILRVGIPCIVAPHRGVPFGEFERVAVAWNGSPEAMRAVYSALPFLRGKRVLLLRGEDTNRYHGVDWEPPFNIGDWLRQRGVTVEEHTVAAKPDAVGGVLLEEAAQFRAGLLVMGAYGRSRFSEWMLGGATRHVLTWADIPVFLRH